MTIQTGIQSERLFFLEFLALFTGQVSRKDLIARFSISEAAATKDLSAYTTLAPNRIEYNLRKKHYTYVSGAPHFYHNVDQSLFALAGERAIAVDYDHAKKIPSWVHSDMKSPLSLECVSAITRCIHQRKKLKASYYSLTSGQTERILSPLALINDGLRWHVRCFDHNKSSHRDFNLTRFLSVLEGDTSSATLEDDDEWNTVVIVKLQPHPKAAHPETIKFDYDIADDVKIVEIRSCLVGYFLRHWNIDYSDDASGNPKAKQLFLKNKSELIELGVDRWAFDSPF